MKLDNLANPYRDSSGVVRCNQFEDGYFPCCPTEGECFDLFDYADHDYLRIGTSIVMSVWRVGSEDKDKLVLPTDFPSTARNVELPKEVREGDYVFATMNSLYWLQPDFAPLANSTPAV